MNMLIQRLKSKTYWVALIGALLTVVEVNSGFLSTLLPVQYRQYNLKSTGEQFGMMFDDAVNSTTTWVDWQQGIKDRIPK